MRAQELVKEPDVRKTTLDVLAEFFQDQFNEDPAGVSDWLAQGGTSVDLFVDLVKALRNEPLTNGQRQENDHG